MYTGRQLLILRHGKSRWNLDVIDYYRPLKRRGKKAAQGIGAWLLNEALIPDLIVSSPATRAIATANEIATIVSVANISEDEDIYQATENDLLQVLSNIPVRYSRPMIVGHNPGLEALLLFLAAVPGSYYQDWKLLTTGTIAVLNMPTHWEQLERECAQLVALVRGRDL